MEKSLFEFEDYRTYLESVFPVRGEKRGGRLRLAEALGVQKTFISAVFHGKMSLSLEQALKASRFLQHRPEEEEFFLLLVQLDRAGSVDLRKYFEAKIAEIRKRREEVKERIAVRENLSEADQAQYYSNWQYSAVHLCLMVPGLQTVDAISRYLGLTRTRVLEILEFFTKVGIAKHEGTRYVAGPVRFHVPADSPLVLKHHANWRLQAMHAIDRVKREELHYSLVMSISAEAMAQIKEILLRSIVESEKVLREAKDEGVYALTMDLFELKAN